MVLFVYQEHVCLSVGFKTKKSCWFRMASRLHGFAAVFLEIQQESRVKSDSWSQNILWLCAHCQPHHFPPCCSLSTSWPQVREHYPLNLSILLSGGRETNKDFPVMTNKEGTAQISNLRCFQQQIVVSRNTFQMYRPCLSYLEQHVIESDNPVHGKVWLLATCFSRVRLFKIAAQLWEKDWL